MSNHLNSLRHNARKIWLTAGLAGVSACSLTAARLNATPQKQRPLVQTNAPSEKETTGTANLQVAGIPQDDAPNAAALPGEQPPFPGAQPPFPGGPPPRDGQGQQDGPNGRLGPPQRGFGGMGQFGGPNPLVGGVVDSRNVGERTITLRTPEGDTQTLHLDEGATLTRESTVTVGDLKVDDEIQVQGVPTGIMAQTITAGQRPGFLRGGPGGFGGRGGGGQGRGGNDGPPMPGNGGAPDGGARQNMGASAQATGHIRALNPLTIALSDDATLTVKMASNARVTTMKKVSLSSLKAGDRIVAAGRPGDDGIFAAREVAVNMELRGMGGAGGRGFRPDGTGRPDGMNRPGRGQRPHGGGQNGADQGADNGPGRPEEGADGPPPPQDGGPETK